MTEDLVLICGSRNISPDDSVAKFLEYAKSIYKNLVIIHGAAKGVDTCADNNAKKLNIKTEPHPADWDKYGKGAGPRRNQEMLNRKPKLVVAFHEDPNLGKGTKDMVERAKKAGIPTMIFIIKEK